MKYTIIARGPRLEAIGAHSGYRIRMSTVPVHGPENWPLSVHVRGSESEPEVKIDTPRRHLGSAQEAFDYGYDCAVAWIDAMDHRLRVHPLPESR